MELTTIVMIVTSFFDAIFARLLFKSLMLSKKTTKKVNIAFYVLFSIFVALLNLIINEDYLRLFLSSLFVFFYSMLLYEGSKLLLTYVTVLFAVIIQVGDIFIYGIVLLVFPDFIYGTSPYQNYIFLFASITFYIYLFIVLFIFKLFPRQLVGKITRSQGLLLVAMPLISAIFIVLTLNYLLHKQIYQFYYYLAPAVFFLALLLFVVVYFYNLIKLHEHAAAKVVLNSQIEQFSSQYEAMETAYKSLRAVRHDWNNHMLVIDNMIRQNCWDELEEYIGNSSQLIVDEAVIISGDVVVDILLGNLVRRAHQNHIRVDINAHINVKLNINKADLCVLISNTLDNAIESCALVEANKYITINLYNKNTYLYISVENPISTIPVKKRGAYQTNKKNKDVHGIGLLNIKSIAEKYHGHMSATHTDKTFKLDLMLQNISITD